MDEQRAAIASHHRHKKALRDIFNIALFVLAVLFAALVLNNFVFQNFNVEGPSMEPTLHTNERLIVNKTTVSYKRFRGGDYVPSRGQIIVFKNPLHQGSQAEKHLVKRVIGLPGERVTVKDGRITVFNKHNPQGFNPDAGLKGPKQPTSGDIDVSVPEKEIFVAGDNREDGYSFDSRNGLGTVPLRQVEGPVYARIWPLSKFRVF